MPGKAAPFKLGTKETARAPSATSCRPARRRNQHEHPSASGRGERSPAPGARTVQGRPREEREALPPAQPHVPLCSAEKLSFAFKLHLFKCKILSLNCSRFCDI